MKNFFLTTSIFLGLSGASFGMNEKTVTKSIYTDLDKDCVTMSQATEEAPIDFYSAECKAFGGYRLEISGGDLRYSPKLSFQGKEIDMFPPAQFHDLGSKKVEWVYDRTYDNEGSGSIKFKAFIYRLNIAGNSDAGVKDKSLLYVVRLNEGKSCVLGTVTTNKEALDLANKADAKCAPPKQDFYEEPLRSEASNESAH